MKADEIHYSKPEAAVNIMRGIKFCRPKKTMLNPKVLVKIDSILRAAYKSKVSCIL